MNLLNRMRPTLEAHATKFVFLVLFTFLAIVDVILVFNAQGYPTFSLIVKANRTTLIWFTFLFGGLTAKVFFNRTTKDKKTEVRGVALFILITLCLLAAGGFLKDKYMVSTEVEVLILLAGVGVAHRFWPQYQQNNFSNECT